MTALGTTIGMRILPLLATLRYFPTVKAAFLPYQRLQCSRVFGLQATTSQSSSSSIRMGDENGDNVVKQKHHKVIHCVRHGKSKSNEWMETNEWGSPGYNDYNGNIRDSPLSATGISQAKSLTDRLNNVELVVVSPLTRCLETLLHSSLVDETVPVLVRPEATERVYSLSETGRCKSELIPEFPSHWDWSALPDDAWWYTTGCSSDDEWRPHHDNQVYAVPGEPMELFAKRMESFRDWIRQRPERYILLVAHWGVVRYLSGGTEIANCQVEPIHVV